MVKSELENIWLEYLSQTREDEFGPKSESVFLDFKEKQVFVTLINAIVLRQLNLLVITNL